MKSWINVAHNSDFSIHNIPFGIFKTADKSPRAASIIGDFLIDLLWLNEQGFFAEIGIENLSAGQAGAVFSKSTLNDFIALGKPTTNAVRKKIQQLFSIENLPDGKAGEAQKEQLSAALISVNDVELLLPIHIPNYTDFYSSKEHATNVGTMFRDPANALLPNWLHLPVGYHGRASSIVVSGTNIHRPKGQTKADSEPLPTFGVTKLLDFELEIGFVIGKNSTLGDSISTSEAEDYIFGLLLFNDWSARDIQKWEYVPLGPFLAKNFASSASPWIVTLEALEPFRTETPTQEPAPLPYLQFSGKKNYDINLDVQLKTASGAEKTISKSNFKFMYWNMCQQLAHHTVNGCNVEVGDLYASGTISGTTPDSYGSLLEITWSGKNPIAFPDGTERKFLQDGDSLTIKGFAQKDNVRVGFGEVSGKILPTK
ncbi:MAG TPA: fumarylacetoacetase [Chitinophagales bacterium]